MRDIEINNEQVELEEEVEAVEEHVEPIQFWENKQRELVLSVVDYNLLSLANLIETQNIDLSPNYQRRVRWDDARQSKLIESFLINVPVPPIFLNEDDYGVYSVIDGKQRLTAIREFLRGALRLTDLEIFADLNGRRIDDLPPQLQSAIKIRANLRATIILRQSDKDVKYEVFRRLNTGGMSLNAQEIRNSVFPGTFNSLLLELSSLPEFHKLLNISPQDKSTNKNKLYREMGDVEYVLRYFSLRDHWQESEGTIVRTMDTYMEQNHDLSLEKIDENRTDFIETLKLVEVVFGDHAFKRWDPEKKNWKNQPIKAIFDVQMLVLHGYSFKSISQKKDQILKKFQSLFLDQDFLNAVKGGQRVEIQKRIQMFKSMVDSTVK